jgi:hypothetical protein
LTRDVKEKTSHWAPCQLYFEISYYYKTTETSVDA